MSNGMSDRAAGKRRRSDSDADTEMLLDSFHNLAIPDTDQEIDEDLNEVELLTDSDPQAINNDEPLNTATASAARDQLANPRNVVVLIRVCFNGQYATEPFPVPAYDADKMWKILEVVQQKMPFISLGSDYNESLQHSAMQILAEPLFLLQETSFKTADMRRAQWITTSVGRDGMTFFQWYDRNIKKGSDAAIKVEVRLRANGTVENAELIRRVGRGQATMENHGCCKLALGNNDYSAIWNQLCSREDVLQVPALLTQPGTLQYFPQRRTAGPVAPANPAATGADAMDVD